MSSCELGSKQNMFRISEWNSKQISSSSPSILLSCESEAITNGFPSSLNCMFCRCIGCIKDEHVHDQQLSHELSFSYSAETQKHSLMFHNLENFFLNYLCKQFYEFAFYYFIHFLSFYWMFNLLSR